MGVEVLAVEGDDAGRLLAAMLQRVQAEHACAAAASAWPKMPKTPHSSCSLSSSKGLVVIALRHCVLCSDRPVQGLAVGVAIAVSPVLRCAGYRRLGVGAAAAGVGDDLHGLADLQRLLGLLLGRVGRALAPAPPTRGRHELAHEIGADLHDRQGARVLSASAGCLSGGIEVVARSARATDTITAPRTRPNSMPSERSSGAERALAHAARDDDG